MVARPGSRGRGATKPRTARGSEGHAPLDASVVAAAERLGVSEIATVERRGFSVVRPNHIDAYSLLP